ncbi:hypothetical protein CTI12_AA406940 [Artemisia annua]|uniref:Helitron helicase-like domain-containing protein n=1 Tax=Artemisia annua TaxID=35608 RepID=A0A2U1M8V3_ARTAN|nr:hypothetical protein CTI12_AA406940 [Artemisia annua]
MIINVQLHRIRVIQVDRLIAQRKYASDEEKQCRTEEMIYYFQEKEKRITNYDCLVLHDVPMTEGSEYNILRSSKKRKRGNTQSKSNKRLIPHIPNEDSLIEVLISTSEEYDEHDKEKASKKGISKEYIDIGDETFTCSQCMAKVWAAEASKGRVSGKNGDSFSIFCMNGKIKLERMIDPPEELLQLFKSDDKRSKIFQHDIRKFNMMFSFTSMGGNVDKNINKGGPPFIFRMSGQNYHLYGTVLPRDEEIPKFAQLYIVDTGNEISNRYSALSYNALVKDYRPIGEQIDSNNASTVKIRLISRKESDADKNKEKLGKNYDLPAANEIAAIVVGDIDGSTEKRDIIVQAKNVIRVDRLIAQRKYASDEEKQCWTEEMIYYFQEKVKRITNYDCLVLHDVPMTEGSEYNILRSSKKRKRGNTQSKSNKRLIPHIPNEDSLIEVLISTSEEYDEHDKEKASTKGISKEYIDIGDDTFTCSQCMAKVWAAEASKGRVSGKNGDSFSIFCMNGKIKLERMIDPPEELLRLFKSDDKRSKIFQHDIRKFNMMFSFTSMGGNVDKNINKGGPPFIFRMYGQNYHLYGTVLPRDEEIPKFAQLYIVDTGNEISNRYAALSYNALVKDYRPIGKQIDSNNASTVKIRLISRKESDADKNKENLGKNYDLPAANEIAAIVVGDIDGSTEKRDIIVQAKNESPSKVWDKTWVELSEDIQSMRRAELNKPDHIISHEEKKNRALLLINVMLLTRGVKLEEIPHMPHPDLTNKDDWTNILIQEELNINKELLVKEHASLMSSMTNEQRGTLETMISAIYPTMKKTWENRDILKIKLYWSQKMKRLI